MKERPILFSAPMVRAILAGNKTQTRRVMKSPPDFVASGEPCRFTPDDQKIGRLGVVMPCPYGQPGDRLWVRESFWGCDLPGYGDQPCVVYDDEWTGKEYKPAEARPWANKFGRIPSIHMPRDCSRILLDLTDVRVERLHEITEEGATAEGITDGGCLSCGEPEPCGCDNANPSRVDAFAHLWMQINGQDAWTFNPWVWVIEFKRVSL